MRDTFFYPDALKKAALGALVVLTLPRDLSLVLKFLIGEDILLSYLPEFIAN